MGTRKGFDTKIVVEERERKRRATTRELSIIAEDRIRECLGKGRRLLEQVKTIGTNFLRSRPGPGRGRDEGL